MPLSSQPKQIYLWQIAAILKQVTNSLLPLTEIVAIHKQTKPNLLIGAILKQINKSIFPLAAVTLNPTESSLPVAEILPFINKWPVHTILVPVFSNR
jgi:hypothetical protein